MGVDWTQVLVTGVPAIIAAVFAGLALLVTSLNRRSLRTPSGDSIGEQVESAHHLTAANTALLTQIHGETGAAGVAAKAEGDAAATWKRPPKG